jgi:hypothetical protein
LIQPFFLKYFFVIDKAKPNYFLSIHMDSNIEARIKSI